MLLADVKPARGDWVVRLADGSVLRPTAVKLEANRLVVDDPLLGTLAFAPPQVMSYQCGAGRLQPLADLKPAGVEPAGEQSFAEGRTTSGAAMELAGAVPDNGLGVAAGTAVTYDLGGRYKTFVGAAGVPGGMVPAAKVRFVVTGDGKELYRSPDRTSVDDPLKIAVPVAGVRTLTLKAESDTDADLGASGLWAEPALIKN